MVNAISAFENSPDSLVFEKNVKRFMLYFPPNKKVQKKLGIVMHYNLCSMSMSM